MDTDFTGLTMMCSVHQSECESSYKILISTNYKKEIILCLLRQWLSPAGNPLIVSASLEAGLNFEGLMAHSIGPWPLRALIITALIGLQFSPSLFILWLTIHPPHFPIKLVSPGPYYLNLLSPLQTSLVLTLMRPAYLISAGMWGALACPCLFISL